MERKIGITSLGCAKNLVDSEIILGYLRRDGFEISEDIDDARIIVVNTCSFITEAEEEAKETIDELLDLKRRGEIDHVIVAGCLPSRRWPRLAEEFPEVDYFLFPDEIPEVARVVRRVAAGRGSRTGAGRWSAGKDGWYLYDHRSPRIRLSPPHYAYLKISEGCSNRCTYCMIPLIKGDLKSRQMDSVVEEARALAAEGVKEVNLISQDTTAYGVDLYGESRLLELLMRLSKIDGIQWIRLLYGHPVRYPEELLEFIASDGKMCSYIDFPLQHVSDHLLKEMNRGMTKTQLVEKLKTIKRIIPDVTVRTTFMVGFPGEEEDDFHELLDFVGEARFEHVGVFIYSAEEGTPAAMSRRQVPHELKRERFHRLMTLQREIVRGLNRKMLGREVEVLVDAKLEDGSYRYRGRTEGDAPEVDGDVYISGGRVRPGEFVRVRITGTMDYDLTGQLADSNRQTETGIREDLDR
jgi:ribosomal protein S12 methylthiotransferase